MLERGVQTKNIVEDENPLLGFQMIKKAGFTCCDFSLNSYLLNRDIYKQNLNRFFDKSMDELIEFFRPHKEAAEAEGIRIHQMHMPYPIYVPGASEEMNTYLWNQVAVKSMKLCKYLECKYIVVHGFKLARILGSEEAEWCETARFIDFIAPMAREYGITICIENLYNGIAGHLVEGPCCDARKAAQRIDFLNERYQAEVMGFCFDVGHANLVGIDFEDFLSILGTRLKVLHIHDNDGIGDLHQIPFTFAKTRENRSSTNWEGFVRGLKKIQFEGVLSFETAPVLTAFPEKMKQDTLEFIEKIGEYLAQEIKMNKK